MKVSANYIARQFDKPFTDAILEQIRLLVESGDFTLGAPLREFELRFSALVGDRAIIAVNSGTDALILALKALEIGEGDEVITVPNTFYATVGAIVAVGATPRFCDVDASHQMDPEKIADAVTPRTAGVLPVWWGGTPPNWPAILMATKGLRLIEDACQGVGGSLHGRPAGVWGETAAFSFHPIKTLNVWGDGGAVAVREGPMASWLRLYRDHGKRTRDDIAIWGVNQRMHTLQCVVANACLPTLEDAIKKRQMLASYLDANLHIAGITIPQRRGKSAWRLYMIECEERERLKAAIQADGIDCAIHYPTPLHLQPPGRALGYAPGDFPVCERQAGRQVTLPCHEYLRPDEVDYMIERVRAFYGQ